MMTPVSMSTSHTTLRIVYIWPLTVLAGGLACPTKMLALMRKPGSWPGDRATTGGARHAQQLDEAEGGGVEEPAEKEQPAAGMEAAARGGPHRPGRQEGRDDTDGGPPTTAASVVEDEYRGRQQNGEAGQQQSADDDDTGRRDETRVTDVDGREAAGRGLSSVDVGYSR